MRILVIEDERRILEFLRAGLEGEGFAVDTAEDGDAGLRRALAGPYGLVVLDLRLPRLDGLRLLRELRKVRRDLPVLVISARTDLSTKLRGFDSGADDYLAKPFSFEELVARVRVQLRHVSTAGGGPHLRVGGVDLDVARRQARAAGRVVDLSDREFRLLYHLASHPGEILSRERLLAEVWGYSFDPGSNVVDVCVRRLRQKLGPAEVIETVRNAGYRLAA